MKFTAIIFFMVTPLFADPVQRVLMNGQAEVEFNAVEIPIVNVTNGSCSDVPNQKVIRLNFASLRNGVVTLGFKNLDVTGPFLFRQIPALPSTESFKDFTQFREYVTMFGSPHFDSGKVAEWAFFCRVRNEHKLLLLVVHHSEDERVAGVRTGEGTFSFNLKEK